MAGAQQREAGRRGGAGAGTAARNREALTAAARRLFHEAGADVPMSRIAREAGVGQAVLYRVFPTRASAVWAVFAENVVDLERVAATGDLPALLGVVSDQAVRSTGFLQIVAGRLDDEQLVELGERFTALLELCRQRGGGQGLPAGWAVDDVVLAVQMLAGALVSTPREHRRAVAARVWGLLGVAVQLEMDPAEAPG